MKSLFTLLLILTATMTVSANSNDRGIVSNPNLEKYVQIEFSEMGNLLDNSTYANAKFNEVKPAAQNEVARLYKFKNSRIKKALSFTTKRSRAKRA